MTPSPLISVSPLANSDRDQDDSDVMLPALMYRKQLSESPLMDKKDECLLDEMLANSKSSLGMSSLPGFPTGALVDQHSGLEIHEANKDESPLIDPKKIPFTRLQTIETQ